MRSLERRLARLETLVGTVGCCCPRGLTLSVRTLVRASDPRAQLAQYDAELEAPTSCPVHGEIRCTVVRLHGRRSDEEFDARWREFHEDLRSQLRSAGLQ